MKKWSDVKKTAAMKEQDLLDNIQQKSDAVRWGPNVIRVNWAYADVLFSHPDFEHVGTAWSGEEIFIRG